MKFSNLIVIPAILLTIYVFPIPTASAQAAPPTSRSIAQSESAAQSQSIPPADLENARKARGLLDQALQALGGQAFLNIHDVEEEGRTYSFYHGRPTSNGVLFWRFTEYPDKERIEVTKERDVAYLYVGEKGYELTYKGPSAVEKKDLDDYLRRRRLSLNTLLRTWINDPKVAFFYDGTALAGNVPAEQITMINSKGEAVKLFFDLNTHLPLKKSYSWRDPVDKERNIEEELYDNYRLVQGVMTPWGFTRYFNGDMQTQRFGNAVHYNQGLNPAMFDPNSGYNPNKPAGKH
ncbi:MAG TPA: hypothetical protein VFF64_00995 [Candidatus Eremiobacteraceae bacterium]|nr:hypothetical protein [Candidatus Eremiobacteraceae bacterium]